MRAAKTLFLKVWEGLVDVVGLTVTTNSTSPYICQSVRHRAKNLNMMPKRTRRRPLYDPPYSVLNHYGCDGRVVGR